MTVLAWLCDNWMLRASSQQVAALILENNAIIDEISHSQFNARWKSVLQYNLSYQWFQVGFSIATYSVGDAFYLRDAIT